MGIRIDAASHWLAVCHSAWDFEHLLMFQLRHDADLTDVQRQAAGPTIDLCSAILSQDSSDWHILYVRSQVTH
jgi:hypothetical protein